MPLKNPVGLAHNGLPISYLGERLKCNITISQLALNSFSCAKKARPVLLLLPDHWLLRIVVPVRWEGAGGSLAAAPERGAAWRDY